EHDDPRIFFAQITGHAGQALEMKVELPEVVVAWMREVPEVQRVLGVTKNLDEIRQDLEDTTNMIERLERAVSSPTRVALFPQLAERPGRAQELGLTAPQLRQQLANKERDLVGRYASAGEAQRFDELRARRVQVAARLAAMPNSNDSFYERVRKSKAEYLELDKKAQQIDVYITSIEAEIVALDKYYHHVQAEGRQKTNAEPEYPRQMTELKALTGELRKTLEAVRQDILVASDEAGINQQLVRDEESTRKALSDALSAEHQAMAPIVARMSSGDRADEDRIGVLVDQAQRVEALTARTQDKIDKIVDGQLVDVRASIVEEKGHVAEYRQTLSSYDGESSDVGGNVVAGSFDAVSK